MLHPVERLQLVAEANSTRSPDLKKTYKKRSDLTQSNTNSEKQYSRKKNSSSERKAQSAESKENEETREAADNKKETYFCKFCKRDGHKISTCRYKQRKEKALKQRTQAQKEKSENNFKEFLKQQLQMLIKEVKEALNPTIMLNEILKRFETHEDKMNKLKHHYEEQFKLKQDNSQLQEEQKVMLPQEQHHEQSTNENQHEDDNQHTCEKQMKNPTQNSKPENAWEDEQSSAEIVKPTQTQEEEQQHQQQNQEDEDEFTWEHEIAHSKNQTQNYETENAWQEETEIPTGFGTMKATLTQGRRKPHHHQSKDAHDEINTHNSSRSTHRSLKNTHNHTDRELDPTYWYIYQPEVQKTQDLMVQRAWIITVKTRKSFKARKLAINKKELPTQDEFPVDHAGHFRPLDQAEMEQANLELSYLSNKIKKEVLNRQR